MTDPELPRRDVLRAAGAGLLGLAAASVTRTVSGHESYETSAEDQLKGTLIPANPDEGFNYPYFLYAPKPVADAPRPILVEPNNTGRTTDDFGTQLELTGDLVEHGNGRTLSEALTVPLLVPVFPRPSSEPVNGDHYVHALDTDTMAIDTGPLERVDLQLLEMVDHARGLLSEISYPVDDGDEILLTGFSASGNFVNRFTALHPDRVRSVTAGAVNGTAILPIEEDEGHTLNYQIGIADLEEVTGEPFDLEAFREVPQFIYMGAEDENDTIPYTDAWNDDEREIALDVYGEDMQEDRMPYCESVYEEVGASAEFRLYDGVGHRTTPEITGDLVDFHREHLGISRIEVADPPGRGDTTLAVTATVASETDANAFEIRAFDESDADVTASVPTLEPGEAGDAHVELARELESGETVTVALLESGTTDPERAIATARTTAVDTARVRFAEPPAAGETDVTLEYGIESDYRAESPIHVYLVSEDTRQSFAGRLEPGMSGTGSFEADTDVGGVPFEAGETLAVQFRDIDRNETIARAETVIEEAAFDDPASVVFADHPLHEASTIRLEYSLHDEYEVSEFVRLQLQTADNAPILLERLEPGDDGTETFPIGDYPIEAATEATVSIVDGKPLASDDATVLVREPDCECEDECECEDHATDDGGEADVTPAFTYDPSDPSAGELVTFDATASSSTAGELLSYAWRFGDGTTAAGNRVSHVFDAGEYVVRLDVVDDGGNAATVEERVRVETGSPTESDGTDSTDESDGTDSTDESDGTNSTAESDGTDSTDGSDGTDSTAESAGAGSSDGDDASADDAADDDGSPGFGPIAGLAGLTGAGYLLRERRSGANERGPKPEPDDDR